MTRDNRANIAQSQAARKDYSKLQKMARHIFMRLSLTAICIALTLTASPGICADEAFYLHDGDRVVFYGDSITQQGFYTSYLEDYAVTRFPRWNVVFVNSGWSGDWAVGGGGGKAELRVRRDVLAHAPTVVTVLLGTNDAAYQKFDQSFLDVYSDAYHKLLAQIQAAPNPPRLTLLAPTAFDDVTRAAQFEGGYNAVLARYGEFVLQLAKEKNLTGIDLNAPMADTLRRAEAIDPALAEKLLPDRIHPSPAAGLFLSAVILRAWHAPAIVSEVEIDASSRKILRAMKSSVNAVSSAGKLSWSQTDDALPMPIDFSDPAMSLLLRCSDEVQNIDKEMLQLKALPPGRYALTIDGDKIGEWTDQQFADWINLALVATPMVRQAQEVHALTRRLLDLRLARWQGVEVGIQQEKSPHVTESLLALDALQSELLAQRKSVAAPKLHHYEVERIDADGSGK